MNETKFRGWHPIFKKMYYEVTVRQGVWLDKSEHYGNSNDTLMQYTDRIDMDDVEIYKGDFIEYDWKYYDHIREDKEQWCKQKMVIKDFVKDTHKLQITMDCRSAKNFKVIGNIYKNPELNIYGVTE